MAESDPAYVGLFPSVGNGFISANVGCAAGMQPGHGTTDFFIHVGGVFNNQIRGSNSIPHRAGIPNPFAAVASITGSGNFQAGTALDLEHGLFTNATAAANVGRGLRVTTTTYAHRGVRSLLVFVSTQAVHRCL